MENSRQSSQSSQDTQYHDRGVNSSYTSTTAPPAYTPAVPPSLQTLTARNQLQQRLSQEETIPLTTTHVMSDDMDDQFSENTLSPLKLRINTSINISKSNNIVSLSDSPANHANAIAEAVTQAIQKTSSDNCGIPMIDGNGDPRLIHIEVDAGMVVDGQGNVVGSEGIIFEVLRQRDKLQQQKDYTERNLRRQRVDSEGEPESLAKRSTPTRSNCR